MVGQHHATWMDRGRSSHQSDDFPIDLLVLPFDVNSIENFYFFNHGVVKPHHIFDEVINIIAGLYHQRQAIDHIDEFGPLRYSHRIYDDIMYNKFIDVVGEPCFFFYEYNELVVVFYVALYEVLISVLREYGIEVLERLRFKSFIGKDIVLELGDEEESACRSAGYGLFR